MAYTGQVSGRHRTAAGAGVLFVVVIVGLGLLRGLDLHAIRKMSETISAIAIPARDRPREKPVPPKPADAKTNGKASAPNKDAKPAAIVTPTPKLPPINPPPIAAALQPGSGNDASAGAASKSGPESGADGSGDGTGASGSGQGRGSGTKPVWHSGTIRNSDYPQDASRTKVGGEVEVRFTIQPTGRVTGCLVSRSSGNASLDAATCRLIQQRFRFRPATDGAGTPVASQYGWRQSWWLEKRR